MIASFNVARTIVDLDAAAASEAQIISGGNRAKPGSTIQPNHLSEPIQYRMLDRLLWV